VREKARQSVQKIESGIRQERQDTGGEIWYVRGKRGRDKSRQLACKGRMNLADGIARGKRGGAGGEA
jgi:hypothetical protein